LTTTKAPISLLIASTVSNLLVMTVAVILPIRASQLGASPLELGLLGASPALIYSFTPFIMGKLADRIDPRKLITPSLVMLGAVYLTYVSVKEVYALILTRAVEGALWATFWPCVEAAIAGTEADPRERMREYNISWGLGAMLGAPIPGVLSGLMSMVELFYLSSAISFGLALYVALHPQPSRRALEEKNENCGGESEKGSTFITLTSIYATSFTIAVLLAFFPVYGVMEGLSVLEVGIVIFLLGAFRLLAFTLSNKLEKILGSFSLILLPPLAAGFSSILIWMGGRANYYVGFALLGLTSGMAYSSTLSRMIGRNTHRRGESAGIFESIIGTAYITGPFFGGVLSQMHFKHPFLLCSVVGLAVASIQGVRYSLRNMRVK